MSGGWVNARGRIVAAGCMPAALAAVAIALGGCGSDEEASAPPTTSSVPATGTATTKGAADVCVLNASGRVTAIDRSADRGIIRGNAQITRILFRPSKDVQRGKPQVGDRVYYHYERTPNGHRATCVRVTTSPQL